MACLVWGALLAVSVRQAQLLLSGPAAIAMHLSWALGFVKRIAELAGMHRGSSAFK
jgi:succinoglycan biosynthesis protein ExoA